MAATFDSLGVWLAGLCACAFGGVGKDFLAISSGWAEGCRLGGIFRAASTFFFAPLARRLQYVWVAAANVARMAAGEKRDKRMRRPANDTSGPFGNMIQSRIYPSKQPSFAYKNRQILTKTDKN
jgi:hypothetical protein